MEAERWLAVELAPSTSPTVDGRGVRSLGVPCCDGVGDGGCMVPKAATLAERCVDRLQARDPGQRFHERRERALPEAWATATSKRCTAAAKLAASERGSRRRATASAPSLLPGRAAWRRVARRSARRRRVRRTPWTGRLRRPGAPCRGCSSGRRRSESPCGFRRCCRRHP